MDRQEYHKLIKLILLPTSFVCFNVALITSKQHRRFIHNLYRFWQSDGYTINVNRMIMYKINNQIILGRGLYTNQYTTYLESAYNTINTITGDEILKRIGVNNSGIEIYPKAVYTVQEYPEQIYYTFQNGAVIEHVANDVHKLIEHIAKKYYEFKTTAAAYLGYFTGISGILAGMSERDQVKRRRYMD